VTIPITTSFGGNKRSSNQVLFYLDDKLLDSFCPSASLETQSSTPLSVCQIQPFLLAFPYITINYGILDSILWNNNYYI
jgi:hypothetical protein